MSLGIWQLVVIYIETLLNEAGVATLEEYLSIDLPHETVVRISEKAEAAAWEAYDCAPAAFRATVTPEQLRQALESLFASAAQ